MTIIKGFFKLIFKLIALPFIVILTIGVPLMTYLFCFSNVVCGFLSVIIGGCGILLWVTGTSTAFQAIVLIVMGFLLSPLGLHKAVDWLLDKLDDLNYSLKDFVTN